ncbi:symplekin-like [Daphnia pulicaria]|uniref:symplekin-like n=1 Tax=Daphnia pulicaria TaxID=35523 RepID=UPI001EEA9BAA|nr:symplekin-like [Daphnia pulicaria]
MDKIKIEKGTSTEEQIVELLNSAATESDDQSKVDCLIKIQELIIHKEPGLLDNFVDEITAFQHDRSADVRKTVVGFIEEACKVDQELLGKVMHSLQLLLNDTSIAVLKRVIQALTQLHKVTLQWLAKAKSVTGLMESTWNMLNQMKSQIAKMIDHDNDGVRTIAVKFYEMIIISQTYPEPDSVRKENEFSLEEVPLTLKIARPRKLEEEAQLMIEDLMKYHGSAHISSANLMACMGSLTHIAKSRPQFLDRIVTAMEMLHANLPPTLSKSQVNSVRKHLKLQLLTILKHPASHERSGNIKTLLADLGATPQEINKALPSPEEIAKYPRRSERAEDSKSGPAAKRRKIEVDAVPLDRENTKEKALSITEEFIVQHLSTKKATDLVIDALPRITNNMPPHFSSTYTPVSEAGTPKQIRHVARLLASQMTNVGIGPGVDQVGYAPKMGNDFEDDDEEMDDGVAAVSPRFRDGDDPAKPGIAQIQPQVQIRARQRALKLAEIVKPLTPQMNESMARSALQRVLKAERTAMLGGVAANRQKILASLATLFSGDFKDLVVEYIMSDPRSRIELAFSWLYEEYSMIMGFCHQSTIVKDEYRQSAFDSYSSVFCSLVNELKKQTDLKEREMLLSRLFHESPHIPEEGVSILRSMLCEDAKLVDISIQIVRQLVHRPTKQLVYLNVLLEISSHEVEEVRSAVLSCLTDLYDRGAHRRVIEDYALMYLKFLLLEEPPALLCGPEKGRSEIITTWTEEITKACLYLFLAILHSNEKLIHELALVYVQANADIKRRILRMVEGPVEGMGMESPELLKLVETCPKGAETLLIRIIHILTDKYPPTPALVDRVRNIYQQRVPDVRFLIPVLSGLGKKEVLSVLPKLIKLNPDVVKKVFGRLLGTVGDSSATYPSPLSPTELLIALHNIDSAQCDMKTIMKATSICFMERGVYTQEVLAVVMQQLMDQNPLPTLLMRTVLQSLSLYPRLSGFVMNILQRLIVKQVWKQKKVWEGFIKCCQRTKPQSFAVILQLPPQFLQELLNTSPDLKTPLLEHVMAFTDNQRMHIPKLTMDVLNGIAQFQAEAEDLNNEDSKDKEMGSPEPMESAFHGDIEPPAPGET